MSELDEPPLAYLVRMQRGATRHAVFRVRCGGPRRWPFENGATAVDWSLTAAINAARALLGLPVEDDPCAPKNC